MPNAVMLLQEIILVNIVKTALIFCVAKSATPVPFIPVM